MIFSIEFRVLPVWPCYKNLGVAGTYTIKKKLLHSFPLPKMEENNMLIEKKQPSLGSDG